MKILVVGGAGYVGSHICKMLKNKGYEPIIFDNFIHGHKYNIKYGKYIEGTITNFENINNALKEVNPQGVIHCAAHTLVGESVNFPDKYYYNNTMGSLNLFKAMIENDINNIVFSSTCAIFGNVGKEPITEETPTNPLSPYGSSKLMTEIMLQDFDRAYGLKHINLRYFNVCGADDSAEIGEDHNPETHLIPLVIEVALGLRKSIQVFGNNYDTFDGTCIRDYIHVNDLATAHILALENLFNNKSSDSFNLGSERGYSVTEIITAVEKVSKQPIKKEVVSKRNGDAPILVANSQKANKILNWQAQYNDIEYIIKTAYEWHKKLLKEKE